MVCGGEEQFPISWPRRIIGGLYVRGWRTYQQAGAKAAKAFLSVRSPLKVNWVIVTVGSRAATSIAWTALQCEDVAILALLKWLNV